MNIKRTFFISFAALACTTLQAQNAEYVISGTVPKDVKMVYLIVGNNHNTEDSTVVNDGKFQLSGSKPSNSFLTIMSDKEHVVSVLNDNTPITMNLTNFSVTGSPTNVQFGNFQKKLSTYDTKLNSIYEDWKKMKDDKTVEGATKKETLESQMEDLENKEAKDIYDFCLKNKNNMLPAYFLGTHYYDFSYDQLKTLLNPSMPYYNDAMTERAKKQIKALELRRPGRMFVDLQMNDMNGKSARLSQWVGHGKYVLVDFWASWCGPCRAEMPHVVDSYKRYHAAKGFEVVGVSFDSKADAWKQGVNVLGMKWPQISDLKGWKSEASTVYGVNSIPSNILVDPKGKIVASDLRGQKLADKLKEIYGY